MVRRRCERKDAGLILFHYMGTGKTLSALNIAIDSGVRRVVVACPDALRFVWEKEITRFIERGDGDEEGQLFDYEIMTYDDFADATDEGTSRACVIVDEVHRVFEHKRSADILGLVERARVRLLLSGTPALEPMHMAILASVCGASHVPSSPERFAEHYMKFNRSRYFLRAVFMNSTKIFQAVLAYAQFDFVHLPYQDRIYGIIEHVAGQGKAMSGNIAYANAIICILSYSMSLAKFTVEFDLARLANDISSYVSFVGEAGLSKVQRTEVSVPLDDEQMTLSEAFMLNCLPDKNFKSLGLVKRRGDERRMDSLSLYDMNKYSENSRRLGMWCPELDDVGVVETEDGGAYRFDGVVEGTPSKIASLLAIVRKRGRVFVYCDLEFDLGGKVISAFLTRAGVSHVVLRQGSLRRDVEPFNGGLVDVCIAERGLTEGYTLRNCYDCVLTEPMNEGDALQAQGRIRRLGALDVPGEQRVTTLVSSTNPKMGKESISKTLQVLGMLVDSFDDESSRLGHFFLKGVQAVATFYFTGFSGIRMVYKKMKENIKRVSGIVKRKKYDQDESDVKFAVGEGVTADELFQGKARRMLGTTRELISHIKNKNVQTLGPLRAAAGCSPDCEPWPGALGCHDLYRARIEREKPVDER